jgi:helix-turn-helix protein
MNSAGLLPVDHRLLAALAAHNGPQGIHPSTDRLASDVGVSRRYVFLRLARLEDLGLIERVPVFESEDNPEWQRRGRAPWHKGRRTTKSYRLRTGGQFIGPYERRPPADQPQVLTNGAAQTPMNSVGQGRAPVHSKTEVSKKQGESRYQGLPGPVEIVIEPPAAMQLDRDPTPAEVLATLEEAFGPVHVEQWPEDHDPPRPAYTMARGRVVDLEHAGLADFRAVVDRLVKPRLGETWHVAGGVDTCSDGDRCDLEQRYRCRRHAPRKRQRERAA